VTSQPAISLPTVRERPLDPPDALSAARSDAPIRRLTFTDGHAGWLVTSYVLARAILGDKRVSMGRSMDRSPVDNRARKEAFAKLAAEGNPRVESGYAGNFLNMDPPDHTRFRRMLAGEFTPAKMDELRPRIAEIVADHLDALQRGGPPADLVEGFTLPIPSLTICELLGVPTQVRAGFHGYSTIIDDPTTDPGDLAAAYGGFTDLMYRLVQDDEVLASDALIARLVKHEDLTVHDIVGVAILLVSAGHQTVANMLAMSVYALLLERRRWESLVADRRGIPNAVEELLRYITTFQLGALTRTAVEDIEVAGVMIRAGESITVSLPAANRDPERFEEPDVLDLGRHAAGHVAFGHGIHVCLGQHLARIELEIALGGLIDWFPTLDMAVPPDEVPMHPGHESQSGPRRLLVTW
jgi:cytochrome P450